MPPPDEQARIREFVQALNEEIAEIQQGSGGSTVTVYGGRFKRREAQFFVYIFSTESSLVVVDDTLAKIKVGDNEFDGQVVSVQGSEVAVGIKHDFHETIPEAILIINRWFLLEAIRNRYVEVLNGQRELNTRLAQRLFDRVPAIFNTDQPHELNLPPSAYPPNDDQIAAIHAACGSDVHFIWGPPGTGKTWTIGFLIAELLHRGLRVLAVAHTNVATDNAIALTAALLKGSVDYQNGKLVRFGNISPDSDLPEMVALEKIEARLGQQQREKIAGLQAQIAQIRYELYDLHKVTELCIQLDQTQNEIARLQSNLQRCLQEHEDLTARASRLSGELKDGTARLAEAQAAGKLKRFFRGLDPVKLQSQVARQQNELNAVRNAIAANVTNQNELRAAIERKAVEAERLDREAQDLLFRHSLKVENLAERISHLIGQENEVTAQIRITEAELEALRTKILREAKVIATSLTKASTDSQIDDQKFDVLVVDEASIAPLPNLYFAASRAEKKIVVVGDFRQLAPICQGKTAMVQKWLARDIFSEAGIQQSVDAGQTDSRLTLLRKQYRMHPDISSVSNAIIYGGRLIDSVANEKRRNINDILNRSLFRGNPLVLCDVSVANPWSSRLVGRSGRYNLYCAALSAELARQVVQAGIDEVGVITPYAAQARLIKKMLDDSGDEKLRHLKVSTVHRFQGLEQDIIIYDVVEGQPLKPWFASGVKLADDGPRLINVSITRPRAQLIVVANVNFLNSQLGGNAVMNRVLERIYNGGGHIVDPQTIAGGYFCSEFDKWAQLLTPNGGALDPNDTTPFTEHNFYGAFFTDLWKAETEIIIVSPFLSTLRCQQFFDFFRSKIVSGVKIKVITKSLN